MTAPDEVLFLLDVDNTLLDNDHVEADLKNHIEREFGPESRVLIYIYKGADAR